jgi:ubiquinone/menaquinone biosynthesis C-methylase UbiE
LSPAMIEAARALQRDSMWPDRLNFFSGDAERLDRLSDESVDMAICIGALEHMLDKAAVVSSVRRVLKACGRFFCLTVNGDYIWYRVLARHLGIETRHLSTDTFLNQEELVGLLARPLARKLDSAFAQ